MTGTHSEEIPRDPPQVRFGYDAHTEWSNVSKSRALAVWYPADNISFAAHNKKSRDMEEPESQNGAASDRRTSSTVELQEKSTPHSLKSKPHKPDAKQNEQKGEENEQKGGENFVNGERCSGV